ncbi:RNA-binding S4 domain-containing protein [Ruminococcaceae bacterium OttesenSCG-928-L11]|nr:RNA-binding S4 domain-containing protein [Ruminococcaceae bacterium OttesenSCG-928-L11]
MKCESVSIRTEFIKLDSFLKFCGASVTGGAAKEVIAAGQVLVDGQPCLQRGKKLYPGAVVTVGDTAYTVTAE